MSQSIFLNMYGVTASVTSDNEELLARLKNDFECFLVPTVADADIRFQQRDQLHQPSFPPNASWRGLELYREKQTIFIDYAGARLFANFATEEVYFAGSDIHRIHEMVYLGLLSRIGKKLDLQGFHKLHAFAIHFGDQATVGVGPSGVGKSTLLCAMLDKGAGLLSDDIPLVSEKSIFAFPLRIAMTEDSGREGYAFRLQRRLYGTKRLFSTKKYFKQVWSPFHAPYILILKRAKSPLPRIYRCSRLRLFYSLFIYMVLGIGTPMTLELFWEPGFRDFTVKARIFMKRLWTALILSSRLAEYGIFELSTDESQNANFLHEWIECRQDLR